MKTNAWETDYVRASIMSLYVRPIIDAVGVLVLAALLAWILRRTGWSGDALTGAVMSALLYYVLHLNAKVDMLKRTLDPAARERPTKRLWV
jgi:hypothetical protein